MFMDRSNYYIELASINKLNSLLKTKKKVDELVEQLGTSLSWLIHYSEKHDIPLPEKDKILCMISKTLAISDSISINLEFTGGSTNRNFTSTKSTAEWTEPQNNNIIKY